MVRMYHPHWCRWSGARAHSLEAVMWWWHSEPATSIAMISGWGGGGAFLGRGKNEKGGTVSELHHWSQPPCRAARRDMEALALCAGEIASAEASRLLACPPSYLGERELTSLSPTESPTGAWLPQDVAVVAWLLLLTSGRAAQDWGADVAVRRMAWNHRLFLGKILTMCS